MENNILLKKLKQIHVQTHLACSNVLRVYLPVAGNIAIFAQSKEEFEILDSIRKDITEHSDDPGQKYFKLKEPIFFSDDIDIPARTYTHLYVRKYDQSDYGRHLGDIDFIVSKEGLDQLITQIESGEAPYSLEIYKQKDLKFIEISGFPEESLAYICTKEIAEAMRTK